MARIELLFLPQPPSFSLSSIEARRLESRSVLPAATVWLRDWRPHSERQDVFFGTFERNDQRGVISTEILTPEFAPLSRITPSPTYVDQFSLRVDLPLHNRHSAFFRQSHEDIFAFGTTALTMFGSRGYPSAWTRQPSWADQSTLGLTSQLGPTSVNDLRFSYFFVSSEEKPPEATDCPNCLGIGAPSITVNPDLFIGTSTTTAVLGRRFHLNDILAWQKGQHSFRVGGDWEITRGGRTDLGNEPVTMTLFSPQNVKDYNAAPSTPQSLQISLPSTFVTLNDILQLPLQKFTVGIGNPNVPQEDFGKARIALVIHPFFLDTWQLNRRLTLKYGLGWTFESPLNYDLAKPRYLLPILGEQGLSPTHHNWKNFSPTAGFAWNVRNDGKTIIRGGAGTYYDFMTSFGIADPERVSLGPRGVGRGTYTGTVSQIRCRVSRACPLC